MRVRRREDEEEGTWMVDADGKENERNATGREKKKTNQPPGFDVAAD